ncbi:MAG: oligoribonuclease [Pseudomonadota bacterium]
MKGDLVWIDLEMTGLDPETDVIVEIATIITDGDLNILTEGPNIAIKHPKKVLDTMDGWSRTHHEESGLLDRIEKSPYDCKRAEEVTLDFISKRCKEGEGLLCGNSIWQDRHFLRKHMPKLEAFFHYRNVDVSTIKELVKRWYPDLPPYEKKKAHLAMSDIEESINELRYYREKVFM